MRRVKWQYNQWDGMSSCSPDAPWISGEYLGVRSGLFGLNQYFIVKLDNGEVREINADGAILEDET